MGLNIPVHSADAESPHLLSDMHPTLPLFASVDMELAEFGINLNISAIK